MDRAATRGMGRTAGQGRARHPQKVWPPRCRLESLRRHPNRHTACHLRSGRLGVPASAVSRGSHGYKYYLAIADRLPNESSWSITFPDFPGVISVAEKFSGVMRQAKDALATAVEDMERDGEALPPSVEDDALPSYDRTAHYDPRVLLVPVETAGRALRVNVSLDEGLLARIDDVSKRTGLSRSALLARGARLLIAIEISS